MIQSARQDAQSLRAVPHEGVCQYYISPAALLTLGFKQTNLLREVVVLFVFSLVLAGFRYSASSRADAFFQLTKLVFKLSPARIDDHRAIIHR